MTIRNILVPFNTAGASAAALAIALKMAKKYDAHVTGLFCGDPRIALRSGLGAWPELVEAVRAGHERLRQEARDRFHAAIAAEASDRAGKTHWIAVEREVDTAIMEYARYVDITVIGASPEGTVSEETEFHADRICLASGRPVLVVPKDYRTDTLGEHAIVAWDGKRAAARALGDAMQILESKSKVTVLSVGEDHTPEPKEGLDIVEHLRRHGLETEFVHIPRKDRSVAKAIAGYCATSGAGILVMGAYEHSKFNEDLFGGVTHSVLRNLTIPTLMAH
ncbi:MAG TPA: universal stress protein [Devosiaceae bacterium]